VALGRELAVPAPDSPTGGKLTLLVCHLDDEERLPVLRLPDGTTINGSANIIAWANDHPPTGE
jgi:hypothetical protein